MTTERVQKRLKDVEALEIEVKKVLQKDNQEIQKKCLEGYCPKNCCVSYKLGKLGRKKLTAVTELVKGADFHVVTRMLPPGPVDERPVVTTVGLDHMLVEDKNSKYASQKYKSINVMYATFC
ncbi:hypothetical protein F0562_030683 [Nyssa sinensis]|uniref:Uncharacterized protein n=1 Tax=Nyssa sinensis TaxID=561372 RepID=A0A5J5AZF8_9ASTE|nr:hypothetical protein F0562_030683 [Nyssa sinensis]